MSGKPLTHVEVRIVGVGTGLTTDSGEFQIALPEDFKPGTPIIIQVKKWVVIDPYDGGSGRTYVRRNSSEPMRVLVGRKGDSKILTSREVIQEIVSDVLSQSESSEHRPITRDTFLIQRAADLGFTLDQLKNAINSWAERVEGPYQKGLLALYERRYVEADRFLNESINASQPDLLEKLLVRATVQEALVNYHEAEALLEKARALDPANRVVRVRMAGVFADEGKLGEAKTLYAGLLEGDENGSPPLNFESLEAAAVLNNLAQVEFYLGSFKSARERYAQALLVVRNHIGPEDPAVAAVVGNIAELDRIEGKFAVADQRYREALKINERAFGQIHPEVAADLVGLAAIYIEQGEYDLAQPLAERALGISKSLGTEGRPKTGRELNSMGAIRLGQKRYSEAEAFFRQALKIDEETLGPIHPNVAITVSNLAVSVEAKGDLREAETLWNRALEIDRKIFGAEHPTVANRLNCLSLLYWKSGRLPEAEALSRHALRIDEDVFGTNHFVVGYDLDTLALVLEDEGRLTEAEELYLRSLKIEKGAFGDDDYRVAIAEQNLAHALRSLGRPEEAEAHEQQAKRIQEKGSVKTDVKVLSAPSIREQ